MWITTGLRCFTPHPAARAATFSRKGRRKLVSGSARFFLPIAGDGEEKGWF
jgi:hypothetical protein